MTEPKYPNPIPDYAVEVVIESSPDGQKLCANYLIDGGEIGFRRWYESGTVMIEYGLKDGVKHGSERWWGEDGQIEEEMTYIDGKEHGEHIQYWDGQRIGSYRMEHGTGLDVWFNSPGILAEERYYVDGERHGYERWWNGDSQTINTESHYLKGIEHGIFREWNEKHKLRREFPRYYIHGERVTKRQYERACKTDPTLPSYDHADDLPSRKLPPLK